MSTDKKTDSNADSIDLSGYESPDYGTGAYSPNDKYQGYYPNKPECKYPGQCPDASKYPKNTFANKLKKMLQQKVTIYTMGNMARASAHGGCPPASQNECPRITGHLNEVGEDYIVLRIKDINGKEREMCVQFWALTGFTPGEYDSNNKQKAGIKSSVDDDQVPEL